MEDNKYAQGWADQQRELDKQARNFAIVILLIIAYTITIIAITVTTFTKTIDAVQKVRESTEKEYYHSLVCDLQEVQCPNEGEK